MGRRCPGRDSDASPQPRRPKAPTHGTPLFQSTPHRHYSCTLTARRLGREEGRSYVRARVGPPRWLRGSRGHPAVRRAGGRSTRCGGRAPPRPGAASPIELVASAGVVTPDTFTLRDIDAKRYLSEIERRLAKKGVRVRTRVALGLPADEILAAAKVTGADLIAMATHGRAGLGRALFGSVAESVLRASPIPVLLIRTMAKTEAAPERGGGGRS
jgi:nucleotide-binding universal stress UspA family protein